MENGESVVTSVKAKGLVPIEKNVKLVNFEGFFKNSGHWTQIVMKLIVLYVT